VAVPARAAPVPVCTIPPAMEKRKGPLAFFTADRSAPRGSLGYVAGDPQLLGGTRLTLAPRPPGLPPRPVRPTRGALPRARLQAARCAPRASAGAASRSSSGPFEVEARTQRIPPGRSTKGSLDGTLCDMSSPSARADWVGVSPTALMNWGIRSAPESEHSVQISVLEHAPDSRTWLRRTFRGSVGCPIEPRASLPRSSARRTS